MIVDSATLAKAGQVGEPNVRVPMKTLGQKEFLDILITQMRNQDPLKPMSDTEFIAQMAQFSNLEQTKSMQADIAKLRSGQSSQYALGLIGQEVIVSSGEGDPTKGIVTGIQIKDGEPIITIGDKTYPLGDITTVRQAATN